MGDRRVFSRLHETDPDAAKDESQAEQHDAWAGHGEERVGQTERSEPTTQDGRR